MIRRRFLPRNQLISKHRVLLRLLHERLTDDFLLHLLCHDTEQIQKKVISGDRAAVEARSGVSGTVDHVGENGV